MRNLTKAYFDQNTTYYSESKDTLIQISDMAPAHAANAARRLLMDAATWRDEAGVNTSQAHAGWMLNTKLWQALVARAQGKPTQEALVYRDSDGSLWMRNSGGGWRVAEDTDQPDIELMPLAAVNARWGPLTAL